MIEMIGRKFSRLLVLNYSGTSKKGHRWGCLCDCGSKIVANGCSLRAGQIRSCGCINREAVTKHGRSFKPEYISWRNMLIRCTKPNSNSYKNYGGRGIKVCDAWRDFRNFFSCMGMKPTPAHSLDRIDGNGHYEPGNVRWATKQEQANNTRSNALVTIEGRTDTLSNWVGLLNIHPYKIVHSRIRRDGMTVRHALQVKSRHNARRRDLHAQDAKEGK